MSEETDRLQRILDSGPRPRNPHMIDPVKNTTIDRYNVIKRTYTVTVDGVVNEIGEHFWRVTVTNAISGEIVERDYLVWIRGTQPEGFMPDDAASDLLGIVLTS